MTGDRVQCGSPLTTVGEDDIDHEENDSYIADQQGTTKKGNASKQFADFQGQQQRSRDACHPFGPGPPLPETVAFGKTQRGIGESDAGGGPEPGVGNTVGKVQKALGETMIGADVQERQQALGYQPGVFMYEGQRADPHQDYEDTFEKLEAGDGPEHLPLAAVRIWRFPGLLHE